MNVRVTEHIYASRHCLLAFVHQLPLFFEKPQACSIFCVMPASSIVATPKELHCEQSQPAKHVRNSKKMAHSNAGLRSQT
jgi:hypothetical protein